MSICHIIIRLNDNSDSEGEDVVSEELAVSSASEPLISVNALKNKLFFRSAKQRNE